MKLLLCCGALASGMCAAAQTPSADEIMQRVAANQDRAQEQRLTFVYQQKILVRMIDRGGKVRREETGEYVVTPGAKDTKKESVAVSGRYLRKGKYIEYVESGTKSADDSGVDAELIHELRQELTNDAGSRDGLNRKLFPLSTSEIGQYDFTLKGEETWRGMRVYRVAFAPKPKKGIDIDIDTNDGPWAGEALITCDDFQPVNVTTRLAQNVPFAIRVLLGTNIRGLGFAVAYDKFDGVWFPVSYGTEFYVRVLFGWARTMTVSLNNSGFRRANVKSTIQFGEIK